MSGSDRGSTDVVFAFFLLKKSMFAFCKLLLVFVCKNKIIKILFLSVNKKCWDVCNFHKEIVCEPVRKSASIHGDAVDCVWMRRHASRKELSEDASDCTLALKYIIEASSATASIEQVRVISPWL